MKQLLREILGSAIFSEFGGDKMVFAPQAESSAHVSESNPHTSGTFAIPADLFPSDFEIHYVPGNKNFLESVIEKVPIERPARIYIFPPLLSRRFLSDRMRAEFPMMDFAEIVLTRLLEIVAPGTLIWVTLPEAFCVNESARAGRERIAKHAKPRLIIANDVSAEVFNLGLHRQLRMVGLLLEKGNFDGNLVRFFKCPQTDNERECSAAIGDFKRLIRLSGGKTNLGFVLREGIPPGTSWFYQAHHPDLARREADLAHLGAVQRLGDLVEVIRGIHPAMDRNLLIEPSSSDGVVLLEGRAIKADGTIDLEEPRYRVSVPPERQVQLGDICIRAIQGSQERLTCAIFESAIPAAPSFQSVLTLRLRDASLRKHADFLVSYLRSSACRVFLQSQGVGIQINANKLLALPVPIADEPLRVAVDTLGHAATQFREWAEELEAARSSLFESQSARNARVSAMSMGRLAKQRYEAASLVTDFRQRVRTRFPHPIAFRWRTVESQHANLEGYIQVLECAEVTVTYLAVMAMLLAKSVNKPIPWLGQLSKRISTTGHGTNMGDWITILQDVKGDNFAGDIPDTTPFVEVTRFQSDKQVEGSLRKLASWRNDQSHGRGPKGSAVEVAFAEAKQQLEILLESVEFISDYPLRFVEETRRDTFRRLTTYTYRELMGDHALVSVTQGETADAEVEARSLYLCDRAAKLHLLRPLLIGRECPVCQSWGTFFLDTLTKNGKQQSEAIVIKSMEHGHTCDDLDLLEAFRYWGMVL